MKKADKVKRIVEIFDEVYPDAVCTLNYETPFELLVATQLAAQCTDERVNIVTVGLFKKYRSAWDYLKVEQVELEKDIRSTGFYHNKAKNIQATSKMIIEKFKGEVPDNLEDLLKLPGVGRKTANVVLGSAFGIPGIVIDTHATRLSNRIGLSQNSDPVKIENDLMKLIPKEKWSKFCHQLVAHGRRICIARKPKCELCEIFDYCDFGKSGEARKIKE